MPILFFLMSSFLVVWAQTVPHFSFPSSSPESFSKWVIHQDHERGVEGCSDYQGRGFPHCYSWHEGTDFMLKYGFLSMMTKVPVSAAADGEVVYIIDHKGDHCFAMPFTSKGVVCLDNPKIENNYIVIKHNSSVYSVYLHLKKNSAKVKIGQKVKCGETLAFVGSSGISSTPHAHFEVRVQDITSSWVETPNYEQLLDRTTSLDPYKENLWNEINDKGRPQYNCPGRAL